MIILLLWYSTVAKPPMRLSGGCPALARKEEIATLSCGLREASLSDDPESGQHPVFFVSTVEGQRCAVRGRLRLGRQARTGGLNLIAAKGLLCVRVKCSPCLWEFIRSGYRISSSRAYYDTGIS